MSTHKDLIVWQKAIQLVTDIYQSSKGFPSDEMYCLTPQLRRAAISIASNIAEGHGRGSDKDLVRFLFFSLGSCAEVETQLIIAHNLSFLSKETFLQLTEQNEEIRKMLVSLIRTKNNSRIN